MARTPCTTADPTGCPVPDLMTDVAPPQADLPPPFFGYSTDVTPEVAGGRVVRRDTTCSGAPSSADDTKGAFWTSAPLAAASKLNGKGGLSLFTYALGGGTPAVTLCAAFYDVSGDLGTPGATTTEIGRASHDRSPWPVSVTQVSFSFDFKPGTETITVAAGHRIGVRVWPASSSEADIALVYDHPTYPSSAQLNEEAQ